MRINTYLPPSVDAAVSITSTIFTSSGNPLASRYKPIMENAIIRISIGEASDLFSGAIDLKIELDSNGAVNHNNTLQITNDRNGTDVIMKFNIIISSLSFLKL